MLIIFIVNGENFPGEADTDKPLIDSVGQALIRTANIGKRDPREWEVRDVTGVLLEVDRTVSDLGLESNARLFVSLRVGAGAYGS